MSKAISSDQSKPAPPNVDRIARETKWIIRKSSKFSAAGFAFNGTTTSSEATIAIDLMDLVNSGSGNRWFAAFSDGIAGNAGTFFVFASSTIKIMWPTQVAQTQALDCYSRSTIRP